MKFSYNWLKELSGTTKSAQEIAELLTVHSFEVEDVILQGRGLENVVIGEVLTKEKHSDADRLNVATVDIGTEKLQIVCGAPNLAVGQKVPVAVVGAKLPDGDNFFMIKKSKIRGIESCGMICAEDELGLGSDHEGIIVLSEDAPVGQNFGTYKGLDDVILDIDILPNRGHDCLSHIGVAREIAILDPEAKIAKQTSKVNAEFVAKNETADLDVSIDTQKCLRYSATTFTNITIKESPDWLKQRLIACDMQPINNVVDITNYVMLETGQPLHAFASQKAKVESQKVTIDVRQAEKGEKLTLLDDSKITLDSEDVVITDGTAPMAIAGVMGGQQSGITDKTTDVILEVANFDAISIRKTRVRHNLQTDAAYRFEREIDPNLVDVALQQVTNLFNDLCSAEPSGHIDIYPNPMVPQMIILSPEKVVQLLGVEITEGDISKILGSLRISTELKKSKLICTIPTDRIDLTDQTDLIEEVGRIYGYEKITPLPLQGHVQAVTRNEQRAFEHSLRDIFVAGGYDEVKGYAFYAVEDAQNLGLDDERHVSLINPMSSDQALMRRTLASSLLRAAKKNLSYFANVQIFEIGHIFEPQESGLPEEKVIAGALVVSRDDSGEQFFQLKGMVDLLLKRYGIIDHYFDPLFDEDQEDVLSLHPSRKALIKLHDGTCIGVIGEVTKRANKYFGLKKVRAAFCEIDLHLLQKSVQTETSYEPLAKFPGVTRDISMVVDIQTRVADVERIIYAAGGDMLIDVALFDLYIDDKKEERSFAFHLAFSHSERTLKSKEIDDIITIVITALEKEEVITVRK